jgi:hypothetical protein
LLPDVHNPRLAELGITPRPRAIRFAQAFWEEMAVEVRATKLPSITKARLAELAELPVTELERVRFVMKGGAVHRDEPSRPRQFAKRGVADQQQIQF